MGHMWYSCRDCMNCMTFVKAVEHPCSNVAIPNHHILNLWFRCSESGKKYTQFLWQPCGWRDHSYRIPSTPNKKSWSMQGSQRMQMSKTHMAGCDRSFRCIILKLLTCQSYQPGLGERNCTQWSKQILPLMDFSHQSSGFGLGSRWRDCMNISR